MIVLALVLASSLQDLMHAPLFLGPSIKSVRAKLGEPEQATFRLIESPHEEKMRNVRTTLVYPGARVTMINVLCCETTLLENIRFTDLKLARDAGIDVPATEDELLRILGKPAKRDAGTLIYELENEIGIDTLRFTVSDGRVTAVEWTFVID